MKRIYITESQYEALKSVLFLPSYGEFNDADEYVELPSDFTGLNDSVYLDDCRLYERNDHTRCLYYKKIPVSISYEPRNLVNGNKVSDCLTKFIRDNYRALVDLSDAKIDIDSFSRFVCPFQQLFENFNRNSFIINEMANLIPAKSKLPTTLWLDTNQSYKKGRHGQRIKFETDSAGNFCTMTISDNPQIIGDMGKSKLTTDDLQKIKLFVIYNKDILLKLGDKKIDYRNDFIPNMILVDKNNKPINPDVEHTVGYDKCGEITLGFTPVKNENGKFNFVDSNENLVSNKWFEAFAPFAIYGDEVYAYVKINQTWFQLYPNGGLRVC